MTIVAWQAKEYTLRLWVKCTYNEFKFLGDVWSALNNEII
jgi:hypothetical protein